MQKLTESSVAVGVNGDRNDIVAFVSPFAPSRNAEKNVPCSVSLVSACQTVINIATGRKKCTRSMMNVVMMLADSSFRCLELICHAPPPKVIYAS